MSDMTDFLQALFDPCTCPTCVARRIVGTELGRVQAEATSRSLSADDIRALSRGGAVQGGEDVEKEA